MTIEAVVFEFARIRLVVAHIEPNALEVFDQEPRDALIAVPNNSNFPRSLATLPNRCEAVNRNDDRDSANIS